MARPKKESSMPDAKQRINDAFWHLLEAQPLNEVTIGMIVAEARCNRGTFYYHYDDIDDLIYSIIEKELLKDNALPNAIFNIASGIDQEETKRFVGELDQRIKRLCLLMDKGGMGVVNEKFKAVVIDMWQVVLCPDGSPLNDNCRLIIEYGVSGILGVISYQAKASDVHSPISQLSPFFKDVSGFLLSQMSKAQGVPQDEILSRLKMIGQFTRLPNARSEAS